MVGLKDSSQDVELFYTTMSKMTLALVGEPDSVDDVTSKPPPVPHVHVSTTSPQQQHTGEHVVASKRRSDPVPARLALASVSNTTNRHRLSNPPPTRDDAYNSSAGVEPFKTGDSSSLKASSAPDLRKQSDRGSPEWSLQPTVLYFDIPTCKS